MSLVIRLTPIGKKGERRYRIVVKEKRSRRDGKAIEYLGWYHKTEKDELKEFRKDRFDHWVKQGAIPSLTVKEIVEK